ncbi:hypothetical protein A0O28_0009570 [Trichoderma guizhouense]|uniref:Branched-chain-amino-acid aminotransferase n=1 Tax=Trichoderma guizhouense TaxID=1491466 RepID=A0A1T3CIF2_9HYPO|nr:hypothetical protein A0O28_0009570 [Trichoderma guizhouense]
MSSADFATAVTKRPQQEVAMPLIASNIKFTQATNPREVPQVDSNETWAQNVSSDHMLTCQWTMERGWDAPEIKPVADLSISPLVSCLHYATQCFEGMKVYRGFDGKIRLFRPELNAKRLAMSAKCVSLPQFDADELVKLIMALVQIETPKWLQKPGSFLYIRPALIGNDAQLGVRVPKKATLFILLMCWPDFSKSNLRLLTSRGDAIRAWPGGFGHAKVGANYGPSFVLHDEAVQAGYDQVLWLFGPEGQVTEAGASNFFAVIRSRETGRHQLLTAPLDEKIILDGVTRRSVIELVKANLANELEVVESCFTMSDLQVAWEEGRFLEAFVSGTAFFITKVAAIRYNHQDLDLPQNDDPLATNYGSSIRSWLHNIMFGKEQHEWGVVVDMEASNISY